MKVDVGEERRGEAAVGAEVVQKVFLGKNVQGSFVAESRKLAQ